MKFLTRFLTTWFGAGLFPVAPGTAGSLLAIPYLLFLGPLFSSVLIYFHRPHQDLPWIFLIHALILTLVASFLAGLEQTWSQQRDPQTVVIDEVVGMSWGWVFLSFYWNPDSTWLHFISTQKASLGATFVLFRFFDILKIFPGKWVDSLSKTSSSPWLRGAAITLDDVVAGVYTYVILILFWH